MKYIEYPIIVEGKYDKAHLSSFLEAEIYTTDGFSIYDKYRQKELLKAISHSEKVIVITDSDTAGFRIRGYLSNIIKNKEIIHIYLPQIEGKEKRKEIFSADGFLGVEGIEKEYILAEFERQGLFSERKLEDFSSALFYELGLIGAANSSALRTKLIEKLSLPKGISSSALRKLLPKILTEVELIKIIEELK